MSHEYMRCKGCGNPFMEHLMSHTSQGSFCDSCYKRLKLKPSDEELGIKVCSNCNQKYLQRNFKTPYPDDICGVCGESSIQKVRVATPDKNQRTRDVLFKSDENQARDVILGFIRDTKDKRVGMRVWNRNTNTVKSQPLPTNNAHYWNVNFLDGKIVYKCCTGSEFPVLSLPKGVTGNPLQSGVKLVSKVAGAWVLGEHSDGRLRLISVDGLVKDTTKSTAIGYLTIHGIANAYVNDVGDIVASMTGEFSVIKSTDKSDVYTADGRLVAKEPIKAESKVAGPYVLATYNNWSGGQYWDRWETVTEKFDFCCTLLDISNLVETRYTRAELEAFLQKNPNLEIANIRHEKGVLKNIFALHRPNCYIVGDYALVMQARTDRGNFAICALYKKGVGLIHKFETPHYTHYDWTFEMDVTDKGIEISALIDKYGRGTDESYMYLLQDLGEKGIRVVSAPTQRDVDGGNPRTLPLL